MLRKFIITLLSVTLLSACTQHKPPTPVPQPPTITHITVATVLGATVWGDNPAAHVPETFIGDSGTASFDVHILNFNMCAKKIGYTTACVPAPTCKTQCSIDIVKLPPQHLDAGIHQRVRVSGEHILLADGSTIKLSGFSDFSLLQKLQRGDDIGPLLDDRISVGAQMLRVFTMYTGTPGDPNDQGIGSSNGMGKFIPSDATYVAAEQLASMARDYGLVVEFVGIADEQVLNIDVHNHMNRLLAAVGNDDNVIVEICNEPFKNGCNPDDRSLVSYPHTISIAGGDFDICWDAPCSHQPTIYDYFTWHSNRDSDWYNDGRAAGDIRDGAGVYSGARVAIFADEPMGFGEPGNSRRSSSVDAAHWGGAVFGLFAAEATYHSDNGINGQLLSDSQRATAKAFLEAFQWVPLDAQFSGYMRGCAQFNPDGSPAGNWPACIGNMPLLHNDIEDKTGAGSSRTYCKFAIGFFFCQATNPEPKWTPRPLRGCTVVDQPWRGSVKLSCPDLRK